MDDEVEHPVGEHREADDDARANRSGTKEHAVRDAAHDRPRDRGEQAVRIGHVEEVEWVRGRDAGNDADFFDAEEDQRRPDDIEQLDGEEEHPEWDGAISALGAEAYAVVADEHVEFLGSLDACTIEVQISSMQKGERSGKRDCKNPAQCISTERGFFRPKSLRLPNYHR